MTREEKIIQFFKENTWALRWCEPPPESKFDHLQEPERSRMIQRSKMCACMGGINCSKRHDWANLHPDEPPITKDEFLRLSAHVDKPETKTINLNFKSFK